ncbi:hypothetical protein IQ07DRAFT_588379 [Pyrenochaeta sp. DS3sAY3a]|nr:hypothetical protein IQ07DRAFT_588379 [Pyrenochaeta sp. DS3sAY3a]
MFCSHFEIVKESFASDLYPQYFATESLKFPFHCVTTEKKEARVSTVHEHSQKPSHHRATQNLQAPSHHHLRSVKHTPQNPPQINHPQTHLTTPRKSPSKAPNKVPPTSLLNPSTRRPYRIARIHDPAPHRGSARPARFARGTHSPAQRSARG